MNEIRTETGGTHPKVSVIVLTYNQKETIGRTIESILSQEHDFPIEIVAGDDCSPDGTGAMLQEYERKYPNQIRAVVRTENLGMPAHYYVLLRQCCGEYLMVCAGDDYWLPGKMKKQVEYMDSHPEAAMCCGRAVMQIGEVIYHHQYLGDPGLEQYEYILLRGGISTLTGCQRRKNVLEYMDEVKPEEKPWLMEDLPIWLWFAKNRNIHYLDEELAVYTVAPHSLSHPQRFEKRKAFIDSTRDVQLYFEQGNKLMEKAIQRNYAENLATAYFLNGNLEEYRRLNTSSGGRKGKTKNVISCLPGGAAFLRWYLKKQHVI